MYGLGSPTGNVFYENGRRGPLGRNVFADEGRADEVFQPACPRRRGFALPKDF